MTPAEALRVAPATPETRPKSSRLRPLGRPRTIRLLEKSRLPRALRSHMSAEGVAYKDYLLPLLQHLKLWPLPAHCVDAARSAGLAMLTLRRLETDLEELRQRRGPGRRRAAEQRLESRVRKALVAKRLCEQDLAKLAAQAAPTLDLAQQLSQRAET